MSTEKQLVLLTGATGYVGGRLLRRLEEKNDLLVRCMARDPEVMKERVSGGTEVVHGDVLDEASLESVFRGVDVAYYLIHSMGDRGDFEDKELRAAKNFASAAAHAGVQRIIYLGGLGSTDLSAHLKSRQRVGEVFADSGVSTLEFRSSAIVGSGSASFEMVRSLVNRLPVMITPTWVQVRTQPIAIEDVLDYLEAGLDVDLAHSTVVQTGAPDVVTYGELMKEYARQRGLRRLMIRVPVLTPKLSSLWLGLVTPLYARVGRKLIDSIRNETVVTDDSATQLFPQIQPRSVSEAVARAIKNEDQEFAETRWSDAVSPDADSSTYGGERIAGRLVDRRTIEIALSPDQAFEPVQRIGGKQGWYFASFLWAIRGLLDLLVGGVGIRRGRRHPVLLRAGDTLDWWRVEKVEPGRLLRLKAEMKVPGRAWLQFEIEPKGSVSTLYQTAIFDPKGLAGLAYWYGIYPLHAVVFRGMVRGIRREAISRSKLDRTEPSKHNGKALDAASAE